MNIRKAVKRTQAIIKRRQRLQSYISGSFDNDYYADARSLASFIEDKVIRWHRLGWGERRIAHHVRKTGGSWPPRYNRRIGLALKAWAAQRSRGAK